jgi:hypothetical protein
MLDSGRVFTGDKGIRELRAYGLPKQAAGKIPRTPETLGVFLSLDWWGIVGRSGFLSDGPFFANQ